MGATWEPNAAPNGGEQQINCSEQTYADLPESRSRRSAHFLIYVDIVELFQPCSNCAQPRKPQFRALNCTCRSTLHSSTTTEFPR